MSQPQVHTDATPPPAGPAPARSGWLAAVLPVVLIAACAELGTAVLNNSALPVYFNKGLKIDTAIIALIMVPFFVSEALFKSPLGVLADRYGRKPLMLGGALVTVFTPLILISLRYRPGTATAAFVLVAFGVLRLLDGLGGASLWPALFAYVGDVVEEGKRGAAMGLLTVTYMLGIAFGFLAGGFVDEIFGPWLMGESTFGTQMGIVARRIQTGGHHMGDALRHPHLGNRFNALLHPHHHALILNQPIAAFPPAVPTVPAVPEYYFPSFYLASILFAVAASAAALTLRTKVRPQAGEPGHEPEQKITWQNFIASLRTVPQFLLLAFITFFGIGCIALLVKLFAMDEFGLSEKDVGVLILKPALFIGAVSFFVGHLADRWGKTRTVRLGFVLCAVGLWGIPILHFRHAVNELGFVFSASIMGLGFAVAFPSWNALLTALSGERQRGTIVGAVATAQGTGMLLGALVGPALYSHVSRIAPFVAAAALVTVGTVLSLVFVRESALERRRTADP